MKFVSLYPVEDLPLINPGDNLGVLILKSLARGISVFDGDVIVIAQKIISKAEGAIVDLSTIVPSDLAKKIANQTGRDPRLCQVYLDESQELITIKGRMVITRHRLGFICSSSGVDRSNVASHDVGKVVLLPKDPDLSANLIREHIYKETGKKVAVVINDSCGRDDREGSVGMAIGIAGISALEVREKQDLFGNASRSHIALIDELAAAGSILMGQADEGIPVVLIRGVSFVAAENASITEILSKRSAQ